MNDEQPSYLDLYHRHHWMYAPPREDGLIETIHIGTGIECGPGWLPLLDRALTEIGDEATDMQGEKHNGFAILQIKEKFGTLVIHLVGGSARIERIVGEAETLSQKVCEECGAFGCMHAFDKTWYWTLCGACAQERARKSGMTVAVVRKPAENN